MEIDENLMRADLSIAERAAHQAERKEIYEFEFPQTQHVTERGGPGRGHKTTAKNAAVPYTADAAHKIGVTERTYAAQPRRRMEIACAISRSRFCWGV
jgi:hypothetical protein